MSNIANIDDDWEIFCDNPESLTIKVPTVTFAVLPVSTEVVKPVKSDNVVSKIHTMDTIAAENKMLDLSGENHSQSAKEDESSKLVCSDGIRRQSEFIRIKTLLLKNKHYLVSRESYDWYTRYYSQVEAEVWCYRAEDAKKLKLVKPPVTFVKQTTKHIGNLYHRKLAGDLGGYRKSNSWDNVPPPPFKKK